MSTSSRAANLIFAGSVKTPGAKCRVEIAEAGPFVVNMGLIGRRLESRQRAAFRLYSGQRLRKGDTVEASCGNPRCLDRRHLNRLPEGPKAPVAALPPGALIPSPRRKP